MAAILSVTVIVFVPSEESDADGSGILDELGKLNGDTVNSVTYTLNGDESVQSSITITGNNTVTINLNGYTLDLTSKQIIINAGAKVIIKDTGVDGLVKSTSGHMFKVKGTLDLLSGSLEAKGYGAVSMQSGGAFTMSGGCISGNPALYGSYGSVTIESGIITTNGGTYYRSIELSGTDLTIGGATMSGPDIESLNLSNNDVIFYSGKIGSVNGVFGAQSVLKGSFGSSIVDNLPVGMKCVSNGTEYVVESLTEEAEAVAKIGDDLYGSVIVAASSMKNGDVLTILQDYIGESTPSIKACEGVVDLGNHSIINTKSDSYGLKFKTPSSGKSGTIEVRGTGTISASTPIIVGSGNSMNLITFVMGDDVKLISTSGAALIDWEMSVRLSYSESVTQYLANGGFLAEDSGFQYIYSTASSALENDDDNTVTLLGNYKGNLAVATKGSEYSIDLCGHTVDGDITIKASDSKLAVFNGIVNGCARVAISTSLSGVYDSNCLLELNDVHINSNGDCGIVTHGLSDNINITVNGGSIIVPNGLGIYHPSTGNVVLDGVKIKAQTGIELRKGCLEVGGDTEIVASNTYNAGSTPEGGGSTTIGAAIALVPYTASIKAVISGGTFIGAVAVSQTNPDSVQNVHYDITITGGTFETNDESSDAQVVVATEAKSFISGGRFNKALASDAISGDLVQKEDGFVTDSEAVVVAHIGDTQYYSLGDAVAYAKGGDTIVLCDNVSLTSTLTVSKGITLDLNGFTITMSLSGSDYNGLLFTAGESVLKGGEVIDNTSARVSWYAVSVSGPGSKLTVTDVDIRQAASNAVFSYGVHSSSGAILVLNGGTSISELTDGYCIGAFVDGGGNNTTTLVVEDASIITSAYAIAGNGSRDNTFIHVVDGYFSSSLGVAVFHPQKGDMVVDGGTFTGTGGIQFCGAGKLTVNGGTITGTFRETDPPYKSPDESDGSVDDGSAISIISRGGGYQSADDRIDLEINGGTLTSENNNVVSVYRFQRVNNQWVTNESTDINSYVGSIVINDGEFHAKGSKQPIDFEMDDARKFVVSGGTFDKSIDASILADGYILVSVDGGYTPSYAPETGEKAPAVIITAGGTEIGKASFEEAVDASKDGETIVLNESVSIVAETVIDKDLVLDLNGNVLTLSEEFQISGAVTIRGGSIVQDSPCLVNYGILYLDGVSVSGAHIGSVATGISRSLGSDVSTQLVIRNCSFTTSLTTMMAFGGTVLMENSAFAVEGSSDMGFGIIPSGDCDIMIRNCVFDYPVSLIPSDDFWNGGFSAFTGTLAVEGGTFNGRESYALAEEFSGLKVSSGTKGAVTFESELGYTVTIPAKPSVPVYPPLDDDDEYVPIIPPVVNEVASDDDDRVTVLACAAAAVVAALIAAFLILDRKS